MLLKTMTLVLLRVKAYISGLTMYLGRTKFKIVCPNLESWTIAKYTHPQKMFF